MAWCLGAGSTPPSLDLVRNFNFSASCKHSVCCASVAQLAAAYASASDQPSAGGLSKAHQTVHAVSASELAVVAPAAGAAVAGQTEATSSETIAAVPVGQARLLIDSRTSVSGLAEAVATDSALPQPSAPSSSTISKDIVRDVVHEALCNADKPLLSPAEAVTAGSPSALEQAQPAAQHTDSAPDEAHPFVSSPTANQPDAVQPQVVPSSARPDAAPETGGRGHGSSGGRCVSSHVVHSCCTLLPCMSCLTWDSDPPGYLGRTINWECNTHTHSRTHERSHTCTPCRPAASSIVVWKASYSILSTEENSPRHYCCEPTLRLHAGRQLVYTAL